MVEFAGKGTPLDRQAIEAALAALHVGPSELWALITVETSGFGYFTDRRPKLLFERHYFSRLTNGAFDGTAPDISNPDGGGYIGGPAEFDRLAKAIALNRPAALKSASWGLGQVMGENCSMVGFATVEHMVSAMVRSEGDQLMASVEYLRSTKTDGVSLAVHMGNRNWTAVARGYNGPNFAANNYDGKLRNFANKYDSQGVPDVDLRRAQACLVYLGHLPGPSQVDGVTGPKTRAALAAYQTRKGLAVTSGLNPETMAALASDAKI